MNHRLVATAILAMLIVGVAAFFVQRAMFSGGQDAGPKPQRYGEVTLVGVPLDEVVRDDWRLSAPALDYKPKISSSDAKRTVDRQSGQATAKQIVLAQLDTPSLGGVHEPVWIINYDTADARVSAQSPKRAGPIIYALAFVDADSGHYLYGMGAQEPPPGGWGSVLPPISTPPTLAPADTPSP